MLSTETPDRNPVEALSSTSIHPKTRSAKSTLLYFACSWPAAPLPASKTALHIAGQFPTYQSNSPGWGGAPQGGNRVSGDADAFASKCLKTLSMTSESSMQAMIRIAPPHTGHTSTSQPVRARLGAVLD